MCCSKMKVRCCKCWKLGVPPSWLTICGVLLVQVGYGLYPVILKRFAGEVNPLTFSFYRDALCAPLLFFCAILVERKLLFPRPKMLLVFLVLGLTGIYGGQLLYILGVYLAGPDVASSIQPIIPVWAAILAILTCTEQIPSPLHMHTWFKIIGIIVAVGGAIEIALMDTSNLDSTPSVTPTANTSTGPHGYHITKHLFGYCSCLGATIVIAAYIVMQKRFIYSQERCIWKAQPIYVTAYSYAFGTFFMGLSSLYYVGKKQFDEFVISGEEFYALIYAVFIASATCFMLLSWASMYLSPTLVTAFWPVQVLVTALSAFFLTGDQLAPLQYIGAVVVILALFMVLFSNYMDERLQSGRRVPQINCRLSKPPPLPILDDFEHVMTDETDSLLFNSGENRKMSLLTHSII